MLGVQVLNRHVESVAIVRRYFMCQIVNYKEIKGLAKVFVKWGKFEEMRS